MDKTVKNVLAAVGAVAVATTAPVLTLGVALGVVAANPEKAKKTAQDLVDKVAGGLENFVAEQEAKYGASDRAPWDDTDSEEEEATAEEVSSAFDEEGPLFDEADAVHIPGEEIEPDTPADDPKERLMKTLETLIDEIDKAF